MSANATPHIETPQRILVVDDEGIVLVALREILMREGYNVMTHSNPLQALEALKKESFSVIITDQQMPMLTGLEFLAQARRLQPDATRILITAVLNLDTVIDAINKGEIYRFVVKPWLREELLATLKSAVQRYELTCRNQILQASTLAMNEKLRQLNGSLEQQVTRVAEQNKELEELNRQLQQDHQREAHLCARMLEKFSPLLATQARRTSEICRVIADFLNLAAPERQDLETSGSVANIGMVAMPRDLIRKSQETPDELTVSERQTLEQHPVVGQEILESVPHFKTVGEIVRYHHERVDGLGYPDRLGGKNIPWLASLVGVASRFAEARNQGQKAIDAIQVGAGTVFDADAVRAFLSAYPRILSLRRQLEIPVSELRPGMILAKGIYNPNGALVLPEGQQLTETSIGTLRNNSRIMPLNHLLLVTC